MLSSSDIIVRHEAFALPSGVPCDALHFRNGLVLLVSINALALYKNAASVFDPLGNGMLALEDIEDDLCAGANGHIVQEYQAGYVGLNGGKVILITPNDIQLFPSKDDALRNKNEITRIKLG